jgi:rhodanese-related sulfurtransferase
MTRHLSVPELTSMLADGGELAFIDVREIVPFGTGHPLLAANVPLSRLELDFGRLVPRLDTRIVFTDGGDGLSELAAARIKARRYTNVSILDGGAPAWAAASEALFPEIEVPAKGFGAFARINGKPNFISPPDLDRALKSDEDWVVLDSRPSREYGWGNIPGSINVPGADLVRWFDDLVPNPNTKVVVNCMSGTRGILGGLSLVAAGVPNEVRVLFHGTRGWLLDGLELEKDANRKAGPVSAKSRAAGVARAARIAKNANIQRIDTNTLEGWLGAPDRTTYLFDVRSRQEFEASHIPGSRCTPEGKLPMSPERYFATSNARYVLIDDDTVRATVTALWLKQMGWGDVVVLVEGLKGTSLETGPESAPEIDFDETSCQTISTRNLETLCKAGSVRIIDTGTSDAYEAGHICGAIWCSRVALSEFLASEPHDGATILTSEEGMIASLAAGDLTPTVQETLSVLQGGNTAWRSAGHELVTGGEQLASARDDHWLASSERPGDTRQNVVDYLEWEITLLDDIARGGPVPYQNLIWN